MEYDDACREQLTQGLRYAGLAVNLVENFQLCTTKNEQLRFLQKQRNEILDTIHLNQGKLECLDYLILYVSGKVDRL